MPRNEWEREACAIEPPKFNIGDPVKAATQWGASGVVTEVILETVNYPHWTYQIDGSEACYDVHDLARHIDVPAKIFMCIRCRDGELRCNCVEPYRP